MWRKAVHYYRREALKRWRNRCGLHATYGNLLKLCVEAKYTKCAQVICDILKRKGSYYVDVNKSGVVSLAEDPRIIMVCHQPNMNQCWSDIVSGHSIKIIILTA